MGLKTLMRLPCSDWLDQLRYQGFYSCNLGPLMAGDLQRLARQVSGLGTNLFPSRLMEVKPVRGSGYVTLTRAQVPFHNDGVYKRFPPRYLLLYCYDPGSRGGDTLLARGDELACRLDTATRSRLSRKRVRYSVSGFSASRPVVVKHPQDCAPVVFLGDADLAEDYRLEPDRSIESAIEALRMVLQDSSSHCHRQRWRKNDVLVIDNYRVLHARTPYRGYRVLKRIEVGVVGQLHFSPGGSST
jgi:alpha-ketoglutarate-dependent taurine dioxygenase